MYAIKRNDFIFLIGQSRSAKSSLIRLLQRAINKQISIVNVSKGFSIRNLSFIDFLSDEYLNEILRIF